MIDPGRNLGFQNGRHQKSISQELQGLESWFQCLHPHMSSLWFKWTRFERPQMEAFLDFKMAAMATIEKLFLAKSQ